ncbi:MAG: N-acetylmuramoyl-L-alanine amidase CwlD [Clostridia bacterium]|nr:N-acetylmuramoyl-L-alanine amidase CwlD [Clostridia bacterium]
MVIGLRKFLLFFITIIICVMSVFIVVKHEVQKTSATPPLAGKKIVVDAGHGGLDGGAMSKSGVLEKDVNLKIANYLKNYLEKNGAKVIMTRTKDQSLHSDDKGSVKSKKRSDLLNRRKTANNSEADILISVHLNFFEQSKYKGAQVFYESAHPKSQTLAQCLQQELKNSLDSENNRQIAKIDSSKILYQNLNLPSVLVECGFLSNPDEAEKLNTKQYQEKTALAICIGIIKFFALKSA